jgi:hypothetical protein
MIVENVVFVSDGEGDNYYIPKEKINDWQCLLEIKGMWCDGNIPDYAIPVEGGMYVVDIKEVL